MTRIYLGRAIKRAPIGALWLQHEQNFLKDLGNRGNNIVNHFECQHFFSFFEKLQIIKRLTRNSIKN